MGWVSKPLSQSGAACLAPIAAKGTNLKKKGFLPETRPTRPQTLDSGPRGAFVAPHYLSKQ